MPDQNEGGIATEISPSTIEQTNRTAFEASFNAAKEKAEGIESGNDVLAAIEERKQVAAPPAEKKPETKASETTTQTTQPSEAEFPVELMTGEKAKHEEHKDEELDAIQPSAKMGQESRANFDKLKAIAREARAEAARVKAEMETAKAKPAVASESEALKAAQLRIKEMEERVERADFSQSPKYQAIVSDRDQFIEEAKSYISGTEIDPSVIDAASKLTGAKRLDILESAELSPTKVAAIAAALSNADRKERERVSSLEGSKTLSEQWRMEQEAQAHAKEEIEMAVQRSRFDAVKERMMSEFEPFHIFPGNDKWNSQVAERVAMVEHIAFGKISPEQLYEVGHLAVAAPLYKRMWEIGKSENKAMREKLAKLTAAQPANGSSNGHTATPSATSEPKTPEQLYADRMANFNNLIGR